MKASIRLKLLLAFMIPTVMLLVAGFWASYRMRTLGEGFSDVLSENERSVHYAVNMNEAIERMDSAVLLKLHGDDSLSTAIHIKAVADFRTSLKAEQGNITLEGEAVIVDSISVLSVQLIHAIETIPANADIEAYRTGINPLFNRTQAFVSDLRLLNSNAMYTYSLDLIDDAKRAALPGDLIILSGALFAILFAWLVQIYVLSPIVAIQKTLTGWERSGPFKHLDIQTGDELERIAQSLNNIAGKSAVGTRS